MSRYINHGKKNAKFHHKNVDWVELNTKLIMMISLSSLNNFREKHTLLPS